MIGFASILWLTCAASLLAQEQETKLIDRLLRPNLSLTNPAQNKSFAGPSVVIPRQVPTRAAPLTEQSQARSYDDIRVLSPKEFAARHFRTGASSAVFTTRSFQDNKEINQPALAFTDRVAPDRTKTLQPPLFPEPSPVLGQEKAQKPLHAYEGPLTIEQVRELLNKSK